MKKFNPFQNHIFKDRSKRVGFYDDDMKTLYYLDDKNMGKYRLLAQRYMTGLIVMVAVYILFSNILAAVLSGICVYAGMEIYLWKVFLSSCRRKENISSEKLVPCLLTGEEEEPSGRLLYRGGLYSILGILVIVNGYDQKMMGTVLCLSYMIGIGCLLFGVRQLWKIFHR